MNIRLFDGAIKTTAAQHEYITRRIGAAAARLGQAAGTVAVRLSDLNGPRGGVDKRCTVLVSRPGLATLRIESTAASYYAAIDEAASTLKRSLGRLLDRRKRGTPRR